MKKGSITVFLALLLPVVLVFSLVMVESGRFSGLQVSGRVIGNTAIDSVFSGYDRTLLKKYGLLFYDGSFGGGELNLEKIEEEFVGYFEKNTGSGNQLGKVLFQKKGFLDPSLVHTDLQEVITATDYNGEIFLRNALKGYKYEGAKKLLSEVLNSVSLIRSGTEEKEKISKQLDIQGILDGSILGKTEMQIMNCALKSPQLTLLEETGVDPVQYDAMVQDSPIAAMSEVDESWFLQLVIPEGIQVSGVKVDLQDAPSSGERDERSLGGDSGLLEDGVEKILFNEYLLDFFPNILETQEGQEGKLQYEAEYILSGKDQDAENLKEVLTRLMWIREGMNMAHLISSEKNGEARAMATALVSWTGLEFLIPIFTLAIEAAWAYGESILDVRALLQGKKVPVVKDPTTWTLELTNVTSFLKGGQVSAKESEFGLSYKDYLRILLFLSDVHENAYRAMDMIQMNLRTEHKNFLMSSQVYGVEIEAELEGRQIVGNHPLIQKILGKGSNYQWQEYFVRCY